jgi:hypothetical protein
LSAILASDHGRSFETTGGAVNFSGILQTSLFFFFFLHQDAFAPKLGSDEMFLLGKAIKYAGLMGKEVRIIPSLPS